MSILKHLRDFLKSETDSDEFPYVFVEHDGTVRELVPDEKDYLLMEHDHSDSGRPWIKNRYGQRDGWGSLSGFLPRRRVPKRIDISSNYDK